MNNYIKSLYFVGFCCFMSCSQEKLENEEQIYSSLANEILNREIVDNPFALISQYDYEHLAFLISATSKELLVINNSENHVRILDHDFNFIRQTLEYGEGPKEHTGLKRAFLVESGIYTFDHTRRLIRYFDDNGELNFTYNLKANDNNNKWISDVAHIGSDEFLMAFVDDFTFDFRVVNIRNGNVIHNFPIKSVLSTLLSVAELEAISEEMGLLFEGYFAQGNDDKIVYTCNKAGLFFVFDKSSMSLEAFKTIDKLPIPKFKLTPINKNVTVHGVYPDIRGNYSRAISNGKVYILSNLILPAYKGNRPIDVYNSITGIYEYSFMMPNLSDGQESEEISVYGDRMFVLFENGTILNYLLE